MNRLTGSALLAMAMGLCGLPQLAAQAGIASNQYLLNSCASGGASGTATVRGAHNAASSFSLCDGHALGGSRAGIAQVQPLVLAAGDFDEDGVPDLISGFAAGKGGTLTEHRGQRKCPVALRRRSTQRTASCVSSRRTNIQPA